METDYDGALSNPSGESPQVQHMAVCDPRKEGNWGILPPIRHERYGEALYVRENMIETSSLCRSFDPHLPGCVYAGHGSGGSCSCPTEGISWDALICQWNFPEFYDKRGVQRKVMPDREEE